MSGAVHSEITVVVSVSVVPVAVVVVVENHSWSQG